MAHFNDRNGMFGESNSFAVSLRPIFSTWTHRENIEETSKEQPF